MIRLYAKHELPWAGWVLHYWGMNRQESFDNAPIVETKERRHGHVMRLDLKDFFQRCGYYMSSYHEEEVLTVLSHGLHPGDRVIDGGTNIGLVMMYAAGEVGPSGRVYAFEPSPELIPTVRWHMEQNNLNQVTLFEAGISDEKATHTLLIPTLDNSGAGTLGKLPPRYGKDVRAIGQVHTLRGDDVLDPDDTRPLFIKLDIEGFELKAMQGLRQTIERHKPAILCEMLDEMLAMNGASSMDILAFLHPLGYHPLGIDRQGWRQGHRLRLHPLKAHHLQYEKDVLWLHPDGPHWQRYLGCMQPPGQYWRHQKLIAAGIPVVP